MSNEGKKVKVHYVGTLDDGTKFDSSIDRGEPLAFTCMAGQMIAGFDAAVRDMAEGETVTVHLEPKDAYGEHDPNLVHTFPIAELPGSEQLVVGQKITLRGPGGRPYPTVVSAKDEKTVTFDFNHELAGKPLNFEITLVEVQD